MLDVKSSSEVGACEHRASVYVKVLVFCCIRYFVVFAVFVPVLDTASRVRQRVT